MFDFFVDFSPLSAGFGKAFFEKRALVAASEAFGAAGLDRA